MCDKKLDDIIERLERIEALLKPTINFQYEYDQEGNFIQLCTCGTSVRCYKCYPYGTMPEDYPLYPDCGIIGSSFDLGGV